MSKKYRLTELERKAWDFAVKAHDGVTRKFGGGTPYFEHVKKVFELVKKVDRRETLGAASLLHDTVEDVDWVTFDLIRKEFGLEVMNLVKELTSKDKLIDVIGKPNYLLNKMIHMSNDALTVKLCDRLQNISDHFTASDKFRKNYYNQTRYIINGLKASRQLTRPQITVVNQIEGLLDMMARRYKIATFENFQLLS
jgi:(p)ppGpp synthase/HD superfamily hydrolase